MNQVKENLDRVFRRVKSNSKIYLRLLIDSLDTATRKSMQGDVRGLVESTWNSIVYLVQYLSSKHVEELYRLTHNRIEEWLKARDISLPVEEIVDTIIVPRSHRHLRPRARDLERIVGLDNLYETVLRAEALYIAVNEGYEDEEEIQALARDVLSRILRIIKSLGIL